MDRRVLGGRKLLLHGLHSIVFPGLPRRGGAEAGARLQKDCNSLLSRLVHHRRHFNLSVLGFT